MSTEEKKVTVEVEYDMDAVQRIPVGDGVLAVVLPYDDKSYLKDRQEFIDLLNEEAKKGEDAEISELEIKDALERSVKLADRLIEALENYPELPSNWKELMSVEDKGAIIKKALTFVIDEENKKISLGKIIVPTACYFNGEVANQEHILRGKTIDDSSKYTLISTKQYKPEKSKKFGKENTVQIQLQDEEKFALYLEMRESVKGFANDKVPMRVGVMVIDYVFAKTFSGKK